MLYVFVMCKSAVNTTEVRNGKPLAGIMQITP